MSPEKEKKQSIPPEAPEFTPQKLTKPNAAVGVSDELLSKVYRVVEAVSSEHKDNVWQLHSKKAAFQNEHDHLKSRIFDNEDSKVQCRSWLLEETDSASSSDSKAVYPAAVTVRLNPYMRKAGLAWAQVMNLSVSGERKGHGTRLVAGLEELLQKECVDTVVLYPVQNNRATSFWNSMGYSEQIESLLPKEELDHKNGALLPEGCKVNGEKVILPRWEKKLFPNHQQVSFFYEARWRIQLEDGSFHMIATTDEFSWKPLSREHWPLWRRTLAKYCKLDSEEVLQRFEAAVKVKSDISRREREKVSQL